MPAGFQFPTGIRLPAIVRHLPPFLSRFFIRRSSLSQTLTLTLEMGSQGPPRRPFCLRCSKPARLCLCSRIKYPPLDNSIPVIILQHSLEKNHPLNSTRVAKLGLRNLAVIPVTDVNFQAQFLIRPLKLDRESGSLTIDGNCRKKPNSEKNSDFSMTQSDDSDQGVANGVSDAKCGTNCCIASSKDGEIQVVSSLQCSSSSVTGSKKDGRLSCSCLHAVEFQLEKLDCDRNKESPTFVDDYVTEAFCKYSVTCTPSNILITIERTAKPNISWILDSPIGRAAVSNGFVVKKLQREQLRGSEEFHDFEEFEIRLPPGSALLFPSEKSIGLEAVDFEVKQLVVLDGTWGKAKRIYHENPWLKLLPHLKLESGKESLYSEVRHQPKAGCLSTIESIVCAMKGLGDDAEGLDNLLDVFESMVEDQRRCKDEKFRAMSLS